MEKLQSFCEANLGYDCPFVVLDTKITYLHHCGGQRFGVLMYLTSCVFESCCKQLTRPRSFDFVLTDWGLSGYMSR